MIRLIMVDPERQIYILSPIKPRTGIRIGEW